MKHYNVRNALCFVISFLVLFFNISFNVAALDMFNQDFENDLTGWNTHGDVTIGTGGDYLTEEFTWTVNPKDSKMAVLVPSGDSGIFNNVADTLSLSTDSRGYITGLFPDTTNFAYIYRDIELVQNEMFTLSWNYIATDYAPFNDASLATLVNIDNPDAPPRINGIDAEVSLLGATVSGTGNYATGNYGSTGWQTIAFKANETGTHRIGFIIFNLSDTQYSPYLFVDDGPGVTLKDDVTFDPIEVDPNAPPPPVPDTTAPSVVFSPDNGTTDVSIESNITISFDEAVRKLDDSAVINDDLAGMITLKENNASGSDVPFIATINEGKTQITISPISNLNSGHVYYVSISASLEDSSDNAIEQTSVTFMTADTQEGGNAPFIQSVVSGDSCVNIMWSGVTGATGYKIYKSTVSGSYSLTPETVAGSVYNHTAADLTNGTTYYFVVKATKAGIDSINSNEVSGTPQGTPSAPTNVNATAGNGQAIITFTAPTDNGGSPITEYIVTASPGNITATGDGTTIKVTGLTNGITYTFTVKAVSAVGNGVDSVASNAVIPYKPSGGGGSQKSTTPTTPPPATTPAPTKTIEPIIPAKTGMEIQVNGKTETVATVTTTKVENKTVATVIIDDRELEEKLEKESNNAVVVIDVKNEADAVIGQLSGQTIKNMEAKEAILEIKSQNVTYTLPVSQINIDSVSAQLGKEVQLKDIVVNVKISAPSQEITKIVRDTANKNNYQIMIEPVEFEISCTSGDEVIDVSKFNGYVERMVAIPDGVDPSKITTGIVLNDDGTFSHVPTTIVVIDEKYYAKINSLTNSNYSVIWNPKTFKDVEDHWAKDSVNDMGARLVVSGIDEDRFEPDRDITRGEFAAIVVRALGLMRTGVGKAVFSDVTKDAWYYDAVSIAYEYGIISGHGDSKFGPNDNITREEAMTIVARAMSVTMMKADLKVDEAKQLLADFTDSVVSSDWAKEHIAKCVKTEIVSGKGNKTIAPKDNITRAEVAVIVRGLLQKSNLIN